MQSPATAEEQAALRVLHGRAVSTGRELNDTVAALADRLTESASPRRWARRKAADAGARARHAAVRAATTLPARAGRPGLAISAGVTTGILIFAAVAIAVTWQHRRRG
jgi:hypothetical protein